MFIDKILKNVQNRYKNLKNLFIFYSFSINEKSNLTKI